VRKGDDLTTFIVPKVEKIRSLNLPDPLGYLGLSRDTFTFTLLDGGGWLTPRLSRFTPGMTRYSLYRILGEPQGLSGRGAENLVSTGIRSPNHPARIESLYRLS
jgi:hypothetical protein